MSYTDGEGKPEMWLDRLGTVFSPMSPHWQLLQQQRNRTQRLFSGYSCCCLLRKDYCSKRRLKVTGRLQRLKRRMTVVEYIIASGQTCYSASLGGESLAQPVGARRPPSSILKTTEYFC